MEETKQQGQAITQSSIFQERYQKFRYFWYFIILFYFILLTSPPPQNKQTNKQTNKKTERTFSGTPQQLWPITVGPDTNKKMKTRNIKKYSDSRKTTATYNKLLDETRDEHCYILNRQNRTNAGLRSHKRQEKVQLCTTSYWTRQGTSTITF